MVAVFETTESYLSGTFFLSFCICQNFFFHTRKRVILNFYTRKYLANLKILNRHHIFLSHSFWWPSRTPKTGGFHFWALNSAGNLAREPGPHCASPHGPLS